MDRYMAGVQAPMAKIDRYVAGVQAPAGGGITIPYASYEGLNALGQGISAFGQGLNEVDQKFKQARQVSLLSGLKIGLAREISDIEQEYDQRQDYDKFNDISDRIDKARQKYNEQIGDDDEVMQAFMPSFEMSAINLESGIKKLSRSKFIDADRGALKNEMDNIFELAGRSGDYDRIAGEYRPMAKAAIAGRTASGVIDNVAAETLGSQLDDQLWDNYLTAQSRINPINASESLKNEKMFPGLSRDKRLFWQGQMDEAATKKRIEDTSYGLITAHKTDFNAMYADLAANKSLSRYEASKIQDTLEAAEKQYTQKLNEAREQGKKQELDNIYKLVNEGNILDAVKSVEDSEFLTEQEKFDKSDSLKNYGKKELWSTNPEIEAKLTKRIESGDITETDIEFYRGMGLSNDDTNKLKTRLTNKGKDPVKDSIISDAVSYAKSRWTTAYPKQDDDAKYFSYIKFQNQIQDELEAMAKDKPLTRAEAVKHIDEYFTLKTEKRNWWPDKEYYEVEKLAEGYTETPEAAEQRKREEEFQVKKDTKGIPEDDRKQLEDTLRAQGMEVSEDNVLKIYNAYLREEKKAKHKQNRKENQNNYYQMQ